jgi:uncharacterized protein
MTWEESSGRGAVYSWSLVWRPETTSFPKPYAPIIVDLDEGFQMLSNLVDCKSAEVRVGLRVRVKFVSIGNFSLPYFRPDSGSAPGSSVPR